MMKPPKKRGPPTGGSRSGPRAKAFGERQFGDRPPRPSEQRFGDRPPRPSEQRFGDRPRSPRPYEGGDDAQAPVTVVLAPDVARVFRTPEAVNEALRLAMRLSRVASGRFTSRPPGRGGPPDRSRTFSAEPRRRGPRVEEEE